MNMKKLTSILLITIITVSNLYATEDKCINCTAKSVKKIDKNNSIKTFMVTQKKSTNNSDFISLDNNDRDIKNNHNIIKIKYKEITKKNTIENSGKLLACDDEYKLECNNEDKTCECV